ncbi:nuclear transport factor 2 family protein [Algoriphagus sanaruensis]|uniref:DUF4440 domain-containing protein n=1 Tax=Algoriphagus sanaruensis TaxID=1727163 RepID=A0A142EMA0_9BACT|nr:nuclear transport factor 2 family protein [Algoriphagus sanaruensis]AMQ56255.1 hypothetical protein AO498_07490 [Algoriphagus sanaruensis]
MKKTLTLILITSLWTSLAFGQTDQEVVSAVENFRTALLNEDVKTLESLTSTSLDYGHSGGQIENQAEFLAVFSGKKADYQVWDMSNLEVSMYDKNMAIVRHEVTGSILSNGNPVSLHLGVMMIWVKENGNWKLLARQAFKMS